MVLLNALGRLMALPVDVSYTLPESLQPLGSTFNYRRNDYYHFPLGHGLRAEAIHGVWYRGKTNLDDIEKQASFHLYAVSSLAQAIRKQAAEHSVRLAAEVRAFRGAIHCLIRCCLGWRSLPGTKACSDA